MNEVLSFLKEKSPTFYLATMEGDQPRVRPFGAVCACEGKLYLITNKKKKVYAQIEKNPKVELSGMDAEGTWLRVAATLVLDDTPGPQAKMLEDYPNLKGRYEVGDPTMAVLCMKDAIATFESFTTEPKTVTF